MGFRCCLRGGGRSCNVRDGAGAGQSLRDLEKVDLMNIHLKFKSLVAFVCASMSMMFASSAFAQDALEDGIETGFGRITSVQDFSIPLLIGVAATGVALFFALRWLGRAK